MSVERPRVVVPFVPLCGSRGEAGLRSSSLLTSFYFLLPLALFALAFTFTFSFLSLLASKLGLQEAILNLILATEQVFFLHLDHLVDPLLDNLHVPEDGEVVLSTRVETVTWDLSPGQSQVHYTVLVLL